MEAWAGGHYRVTAIADTEPLVVLYFAVRGS
jgi:hypothetical protein